MKKGLLLVLLIFSLSLTLVACGQDGTQVYSNLPPSTGQIVPTVAPTSPTATVTPLPTETVVATPLVAPTVTPLPTEDLTATPVVAPSVTPSPLPVQVAPTPTQAESVTTAATSYSTTAPATKTSAAVPTTKSSQPTATTKPYNGSLTEVVRGPTGKKQVAITLDAGASATPFPKILAALDKAGVKITFFLTGQWAQQNPTYVQQMANAGHELGNHTWDHPDLATVSATRIKDEVEKTDTLLTQLTGKSAKPLFRFPYGSRNAQAMQEVNSLGYRSIFWTLDSLDSVGETKSAQFLIDRITKQTNAQLDGEIILMHIGNATTADALPAILQNLQARGFQVVKVSELLK
jgi:peptidoglycan-N-acetylmuramic acid deacetylase